jgi:ubiquinone/menaquinone biosynthesis C-methylase UbiE
MRRALRSRIILGIVAFLLAGSALFAGEISLWWGSRDPEAEARDLADLLEIRPGDTVADIGAGTGPLVAVMAARVGPGGRVYVTELDDGHLETLRTRATEPGLAHVIVARGEPAATGLPDACCRAVYMRHVFHHIEDVAAMSRDLHRTVAPGGRLAIIDFAPRWFLNLIAPVHSARGTGHGITVGDVEHEVTRAGFQVVQRDDRWRAGMFLVVFERSDAVVALVGQHHDRHTLGGKEVEHRRHSW